MHECDHVILLHEGREAKQSGGLAPRVRARRGDAARDTGLPVPVPSIGMGAEPRSPPHCARFRRAPADAAPEGAACETVHSAQPGTRQRAQTQARADGRQHARTRMCADASTHGRAPARMRGRRHAQTDATTHVRGCARTPARTDGRQHARADASTHARTLACTDASTHERTPARAATRTYRPPSWRPAVGAARSGTVRETVPVRAPLCPGARHRRLGSHVSDVGTQRLIGARGARQSRRTTGARRKPTSPARTPLPVSFPEIHLAAPRVCTAPPAGMNCTCTRWR